MIKRILLAFASIAFLYCAFLFYKEAFGYESSYESYMLGCINMLILDLPKQ